MFGHEQLGAANASTSHVLLAHPQQTLEKAGLIMGATETFHFYDFGTVGRVPEPENQFVLLLETPGHSK